MSVYLLAIYESNTGPDIIDVKAENGQDAINKLVQEVKDIYNLPKDINNISDLDEYITTQYMEGVLVIGEIYNVNDFKG